MINLFTVAEEDATTEFVLCTERVIQRMSIVVCGSYNHMQWSLIDVILICKYSSGGCTLL